MLSSYTCFFCCGDGISGVGWFFLIVIINVTVEYNCMTEEVISVILILYVRAVNSVLRGLVMHVSIYILKCIYIDI